MSYRVRAVFVLKGGSVLACWQSVDNLESRDRSKYFENLQTGGDLPKLPVEVFALSPEPNVRDVMFAGFHLAHVLAMRSDHDTPVATKHLAQFAPSPAGLAAFFGVLFDL